MLRMEDSEDEALVVDVPSDEDADDDSSDAIYLEKSPEFLSLCQITRQLNLDALRELNNREDNLFLENDQGQMVRSPDGISPIYQEPLVEQMIKEGNDAAVDMLLQEFQIKRFILERAIDSYFSVNRINKVEELLARYGTKDALLTAVLYYARLGMEEKVSPALLQYPEWAQEVQSIYACFGHCQLAEAMLQQGGTVVALIAGYIAGGNYYKVNLWLESAIDRKQRSDYRLAVCREFDFEEGFEEESLVLKLLAHIDDNGSRVFIADQAKNYNSQLNKRDLLRQAKSINHIMREYQLNYTEAQVLRIPGLREWMLNAHQRGSHTAVLPHDMLIKTAMTLTHLSYETTEKIYLAVCRNTYQGARHLLLSENTLFAKRYGVRGGEVRAARHHDELDDLEARYDTKKRRIGAP